MTQDLFFTLANLTPKLTGTPKNHTSKQQNFLVYILLVLIEFTTSHVCTLQILSVKTI